MNNNHILDESFAEDQVIDNNSCEAMPDINNSDKNGTFAFGILVLLLGVVCVLAGLVLMVANLSFWIIVLSVGLALSVTGGLLLGISAIVDRLNTIIKLMEQNRKD